MSLRRVVYALVLALAFAVPVAAQANDSRVSLSAAVGPSFANVGTTFSTMADLDVKLNDYTAVVGEFGVIPRARFRDAPQQTSPRMSGRASTTRSRTGSASAPDASRGLAAIPPALFYSGRSGL